MTERSEAAAEYARVGLPIFPVHYVRDDGTCSCGRICSSLGKHPMTQRGVKDATSDPEQVAKWWGEAADANIGLATGGNIYVVDLDGDIGMRNWAVLAGDHAERETRMVITGGGGRHLYYAPPRPDMGNTHWRLAEGIDTRGRGGYVLLPPSNHVSGALYEWHPQRHPLLPLPAWVTVAVTPQQATPRDVPQFRYGGTSKYGEAILAAALDRVRTAPNGGRNETLNREAFNLGQWIGGGVIDLRGVAESLEAVSTDPDRVKVRSTIQRALHDGAQYPRRKA